MSKNGVSFFLREVIHEAVLIERKAFLSEPVALEGSLHLWPFTGIGQSPVSWKLPFGDPILFLLLSIFEICSLNMRIFLP